MPQLGSNPNEVLFEVGTTLEWRVMNYSDIQPFSYASPEEILMMLEEEFNDPICFVSFRIECPARQHWVRKLHEAPQAVDFTRLIDAVMRVQTERARIDEYLNHERMYAHEKQCQEGSREASEKEPPTAHAAQARQRRIPQLRDRYEESVR